MQDKNIHLNIDDFFQPFDFLSSQKHKRMNIIEKAKDLQNEIIKIKASGQRVGFVPTMGALHLGHISLVNQAKKDVDIVVVSLFANPNQFNNPDDLKRYPRTLEKDIELLKSASCDILFYPSVEEIYPEPDNRIFDFGYIDKCMEGKFRPGHFNGVAQVVSRLFDLVPADNAYFGEKDFQQLAIIRQMASQYNYAIKIIGCPIIREEDGLAMSSRNLLLTPEHRKIVPIIAKSLSESRTFAKSKSVGDVTNWVITSIEKDNDLKVEYFEICNGYTLMPISNWSDVDYIVGCIAVYAGKIRLIDNITY